MSNLVKRQHVEVKRLGTTVELTLGHVTVGMDYATALRLADWLKVHGATAKHYAGDTSREFHVVGVLHNADEDIARFQEH